jgi:HAE1 family hydrophobic/amphiphilic exporter-1
MEETLSGIAGIDEIQARMNEGTATITVRFVLERDINDASNDVREKVASALKNVPPQLLPPVINKVDPDSDPVMSIVVSSTSMSLRTLTEIADKQITRVIQTADGVGQVSMGGGRAREVHVVVDVQKLNAYGLSLTQVSDALVTENVEIPGGAIEQGKGQLLLRTLGRVDVTEDFNNIVVATRNGTPIRVSDVGYAEDSFQRPTTAAWLADGTPAVVLDVRRAMGENTVAVIEGVRAKLCTRSAPAGSRHRSGDSKFIVGRSLGSLIYGSLFAAIVVMFSSATSAVIIASLRDSASIISSFTLMRIVGFTLNNMTLPASRSLSASSSTMRSWCSRTSSVHRGEGRTVRSGDSWNREVALAVMATTLSLSSSSCRSRS